MSSGSAGEASCYHCSLPLGRGAYRAEVEGSEQAFCCYGCYLVLRLTGERGEAGETHWLLFRLGAAIFLAVNVMMFTMALYSERFYAIEGAERFHSLLRLLLLALTTPVVVLLGVPVALGARRALFASMDGLIFLGVLGGYVLSVAATLAGRGEVYFETVAMVLVLVTLGRYLEGRARAGSTAALSGLLARAPAECTIVRDGVDVKTRADAIQVGDLVRVFPGDSLSV